MSWHSGFDKNNSLYTKYNKTPVTASESEDTKIEVTTADIGYIYWHWCRGDYTDGPINRKVSNGKTSDYDTFHAFVSTQNAATVADSGARKIENKSVCKDTYWWIIDRIQLKRCTYTKYVRVNTDGWSNWSQWQAEEITGSDTVKVETRTLYRWIAPSDKLYSEHTWGEWQYKPFSVKAVRVCTVCEEKDNKVIALLGDADFNGIVNATDARIALRISVELEKYTEKHLETADIEKDGKITAADARLILRASVGLEELVRE